MCVVAYVLAPPDAPGALSLTLAEARATLPPDSDSASTRVSASGDRDDRAIVDAGREGSAWQADWEDLREEVDGVAAPHQDVAYDDWLEALVASRKPEDHLFARIPTTLDIHAERRWYAQTLYRALAGRELPPTTERLRPQDDDREVAAQRLAATRPQPPGYRVTTLLTLILPSV